MGSPQAAGRRQRWAGAVVRTTARRWVAPTVFVLVAIGLTVLLAREGATEATRAPFGRFSFVDFRDTVWNPTRWFLTGGDPYDLGPYLAADPAAQEFSLYAPAVLWIGVPFAVVPLSVATGAWAVVQVAALVVLAGCALRAAGLRAGAGAVAVLVLALLLSTPGRQAVGNGQWATVCAAAAVLALTARNPWVGRLGVVLALVKPQVALPLLVVLPSSGRVRRTLTGTGLAVLVSLPVVAVLVGRAGGPMAWLDVLSDNVGATVTSPYTAAGREGSTRVDVAGLVQRMGAEVPGWLTAVLAVLVLTVSAVLVHRAARVEWLDPVVRRGWVLAAAAGGILLGTPNETYAVLVAAPAAVVGVALWVRGATVASLPGLVLLVPLVHVGTVDEFLGLGTVLAPLNTVAVLVGAFVLPALLVGRATRGRAVPVGAAD